MKRRGHFAEVEDETSRKEMWRIPLDRPPRTRPTRKFSSCGKVVRAERSERTLPHADELVDNRCPSGLPLESWSPWGSGVAGARRLDHARAGTRDARAVVPAEGDAQAGEPGKF